MSVIHRLNTALIGRYRLDRELGEGGMARVYRARDVKHDRWVAVKVLKPRLAAEVDAERFLSEIRTTANLQHPHILPLFDSGEADGLLFYVMPLVQGESLRERLERDGRFSVDEAVRVAGHLCDALEHAHRRGVLHRDIKPANVMMSDGEPLLADFGIALALDRENAERMTRTGSSIGTPGYMSPEQASGERGLDAKSDIYSLGALTYEMLVGDAPFGHLSPRAALSKVLTEEPPAPSEADPSIPRAVSAEVARALARDPDDRHDSAAAFARALRGANFASAAVSGAPRKTAARAVAFGVAATFVALVLGGLWYQRSTEIRWARVEAVPEIQSLLAEGEAAAAFALASQAAEILPEDPLITGLYDASSVEVSLTSEPEGASVSFRPYDPDDTTWTAVGTTPLEARVPSEELLVRFQRDGYRPHHAAIAPAQGGVAVALRPEDAPDPMILQLPSTFAGGGQAVAVDTFWIDAREVTNAEYRAFLDVAREWDSTYWTAPFLDRGVDVDLERLRATFVDRTGRPGPAGWELSRPPEGREDYPVGGVSWFEAVAYCAFRDGELPTYYHWKVADGGSIMPWDGILQHGNLGTGDGPVPVGSTGSYGPTGVVDMAGNVREWVWNASGDDRYILGGSWQSPPHLYVDFDAVDPWSRSLENGIRCARYEGPLRDDLLAPIDLPIFDFRTLDPVDDATFQTFAAFYEYDRAPLNTTRDTVEESERWIRQRVEVDAAYLDERLPIHLFLPRGVDPPYQTVVYFPGGAAFSIPSSERTVEMAQLMFIPESGRALAYPVLKGTYERGYARPARGDVEVRQRYVWMIQDLMRTVDFVEEAPELDTDALAYMGLSYGAELAVPVALEKRFDALVLIGGALDPGWLGSVPEEAAPWNFVSRITTPTLLINGQYDFMHPYEEGQVPFFEAIDVPEEDKEFVVLPTGHLPPNNEVIRHSLRWLDQRLGTVR
ncbi:MAG: protein kinase [Longimicrobiales bacterium]|nr:protein kinase [Longimicrobiales bacterium]